MEPTDRVQLSQRQVDNEVRYAADAFTAWHLDNTFDMDKFRKNFKIKVIEEKMEDGLSSAVFDVIGIDPPIANALRRLMIARVPTVAFHQVTIAENSSEIPDEILAHRIGLVPLRAPPTQFAAMTADSDKYDVSNSLKFELDVTCVDKASAQVYTRQLRWVAEDAGLREKFRPADVGPVHDNILLASLAPGQRIALSAIAILGRGETHAKWSPVGTAFYRMLPEVRLEKKVKGEKAAALVATCPVGVFDIEDGEAVVLDGGRNCTVCRECIRSEEYPVKLSRNKRHYIFSVESTGAYLARDIFKAAIEEFKQTLVAAQSALNLKREKLK